MMKMSSGDTTQNHNDGDDSALSSPNSYKSDEDDSNSEYDINGDETDGGLSYTNQSQSKIIQKVNRFFKEDDPEEFLDDIP